MLLPPGYQVEVTLEIEVFGVVNNANQDSIIYFFFYSIFKKIIQ